MSEVSDRGRSWHFYIGDMIEFCESVLSYTDGMTQAEFTVDRRTYLATLHCLQLIGEAATHVPSEVRDLHSEIHWREIIGTRNRIVHAYLGIDDDVVWDIIQTDIPALLPQLRGIKAS